MLMSLDTSTIGAARVLRLPAHARRRGSGCPPCRSAGPRAARRSAAWSGRTAGRAHPCCRAWPAVCRSSIALSSMSAHQLVERARYLARIARDFRHAFLVVVELFQRHHRQIDVVFLEAEQRGRVVHQHVGVEHEQLGAAGLVGGAARARLDAGVDRFEHFRARFLGDGVGGLAACLRRRLRRGCLYRGSGGGGAGSSNLMDGLTVLPFSAFG